MSKPITPLRGLTPTLFSCVAARPVGTVRWLPVCRPTPTCPNGFLADGVAHEPPLAVGVGVADDVTGLPGGAVGVWTGGVGRVVGRPVGRGVVDGVGVLEGPGVVMLPGGGGVVGPTPAVPGKTGSVDDPGPGTPVVGSVGTAGGATAGVGRTVGGMPVPPVAPGATTVVGVAPPDPTEVTSVPGCEPPREPSPEVPPAGPGPPPSTVSTETTTSEAVMTPAAWIASVTAGGVLGAAWRPAPAMPSTVSPRSAGRQGLAWDPRLRDGRPATRRPRVGALYGVLRKGLISGQC